MIYLEEINKSGIKDFFNAGKLPYLANPNQRTSQEDVENMLIKRKTQFFQHASMHLFLIKFSGHTVGRFALINDEKLPEYVQVSFFEVIWGIDNIEAPIIAKAKVIYPNCSKIVVGLSAHLNYAAGFLANRFDEPPLFGLPYSAPWYLNLFPSLKTKNLVSYRFDNKPFFKILEKGLMNVDLQNISIRPMDKKFLMRDVTIYTELNNKCFQDHPFWADRTPIEDFELFHPFRFLMKNQHLLIAEDKGKPVGFLLWYPDFNELLSVKEHFSLHHVLKYRFRNKIKAARLTEIAVLPEYRRKGIIQALMKRFAEEVKKEGHTITEGGFIFEENQASIGVTLKMIEKAYGFKTPPYRRFSIFEGEL